MNFNNDNLNRLRVINACQKLLYVRFQCAWITYIFCSDRVARKDIADAAQRIQLELNNIINAALYSLLHPNENEGTSHVNVLLESAHLKAEALYTLLCQTVPEYDIPPGIHPDDWAWMKDLIND